MGVDHGGIGGTSPPRPEFGAGDANANCPPSQILSYRYKNEHSVAFKICQNPFSAGALPRPRWGSSRRSPRPLSWLETPPHTTPHSARTHLWRSPCVPQEVQPDVGLCEYSSGYSYNARIWSTKKLARTRPWWHNKNIRCAKAKFATTEQALDPTGDAMWPTVMPSRTWSLQSHKTRHLWM